MGISKFTAPLGNYAFLYEINVSGVKNEIFLKISRECEKLILQKKMWKQLQLLTILTRYSIVDIQQGSEYASVSDFEYAWVLNMSGLQRVLNMPEKFVNMSEYAWICQNMYECA